MLGSLTSDLLPGVRGRNAPMTKLSHMDSFHYCETITPLNQGIKHLRLKRLTAVFHGILSEPGEAWNIAVVRA